MIPHETVAIDNSVKAARTFGKEPEKEFIVSFIEENETLFIAAREDVVESVWCFDAKRSSHAGSLVRLN